MTRRSVGNGQRCPSLNNRFLLAPVLAHGRGPSGHPPGAHRLLNECERRIVFAASFGDMGEGGRQKPRNVMRNRFRREQQQGDAGGVGVRVERGRGRGCRFGEEARS